MCATVDGRLIYVRKLAAAVGVRLSHVRSWDRTRGRNIRDSATFVTATFVTASQTHHLCERPLGECRKLGECANAPARAISAHRSSLKARADDRENGREASYQLGQRAQSNVEHKGGRAPPHPETVVVDILDRMPRKFGVQ